MWKNTVERSRAQMSIWRMRIACWITRATNTHSKYVTLIAFPLQQWLYESASMLRLYVHCLSFPKQQLNCNKLKTVKGLSTETQNLVSNPLTTAFLYDRLRGRGKALSGVGRSSEARGGFQWAEICANWQEAPSVSCSHARKTSYWSTQWCDQTAFRRRNETTFLRTKR
jgi:hypothetical protein